tara:strand:+ start:897 stop:1238 length:342 start_codon:yes stop_codon:yes gene_type:complete
MTQEQIKELIAKNNRILIQSDVELTKMKVILQKYNGNKTEPQRRIETFEDLINYATALQSKVNGYEDTTAQLLMNIGELNSRLKSLAGKLSLLEKVSETSIDDVINKITVKLK